MTDQANESQQERWQRLQAENAKLKASIQELYASRSWRLAAPLRFFGTLLRNIRSLIQAARLAPRLIRHVYKLAPVPLTLKVRIKGWMFLRFPAVFEHTVAYRDWHQFEENLRANRQFAGFMAGTFRDPELETTTRTEIPATAAVTEWRVANGDWEWEDYAALHARISAIAIHRQRQFVPQPIPITNLADGQLADVVGALRFPESLQPVVSIVIPAYNNLKLTIECLKSICDHPPECEYEVIVADDASSDGTFLCLAGVQNLRVVHSDENRHFIRNVNRTLPLLRGRYLLLLNNDVQLLPGAVDALLAAASRGTGIGAVGPKILYPSGHLQEAGCSFRPDCTTDMVGHGADPATPGYSYSREVDYCSGACLLVSTQAFRDLGGFDEGFAPAYCEDSDLCLQLRQIGMRVLYVPDAVVVHHLSRTTASNGNAEKLALIGRNLDRFVKKWQDQVTDLADVRLIAFYLPQYHPFAENDRWWGKGFTEWRNVAKAQPNFVGHYQPRLPADLGYYDLRLPEVMDQQAALARRYGVHGFCYYYYWFAGKRLLDAPLERLLVSGRPDLPFCLCWANENWTRRWDGRDSEVLIAQAHSDADDVAVIRDLMRYLRHPNYIRINGKPLLVVYRVGLFPDFRKTAATWRRICAAEGVGDIHLALVESFDMVFHPVKPSEYGCDSAIEFPPHGLAEGRPASGAVINPAFDGQVADYRDLATAFCAREEPPYLRFRGVLPGWDNTARRQDHSFCFEHATPGAFQAWLEHALEQTRMIRSGDERIVFVNAWNEWAEGAYLEPDVRFGHSFLEAVRNAKDSVVLKRHHRYALQ